MNLDLHTFGGAYALDALDPHEHVEFEQHLATCDLCRVETDELIETAARLGSVAEAVPPPGMRARVLAAVAKTPQQRPTVVSLQSRRHRPWTTPGLAVAAALLAVLGVGVGVQQWSQDQDQRQNEAVKVEQDAQAQREGRIADVLTAGDKVAYDTQSPSGLHLTVVKSQEMDAAVVSLRNLPPLGEGRSYQVWRITGGEVASAGLIRADDISLDRATMLMQDVAGTKSVAVTEEPADGSQQPTTKPLIDLGLAA